MAPLPQRAKQVVSANTSHHQKLLAAALPQPPSAPHGKAVAASYPVLVEDINDDDDDNPDDWLNTGATDSLFMPNMEEPTVFVKIKMLTPKHARVWTSMVP
jgi:hypothetical protein